MTSTPRRVLVIEPDAECGIDQLAAPMHDLGLHLETLRPWRGDVISADVDHDALLILGGDMGANDIDDHPWILDVRRLARAYVDADTPTLGICLGGQILATACGGEVRRGDNDVEVGAIEISWTAAAGSDALVSQLPAPFTTGSWHRDAITVLPPGAQLLGSSTRYPHQAFRVGRSAWGLQFHPEVSLSGFRTWATHPEAGADASTVHEGIEAFEGAHAAVRAHGQELGRAFARIVTGAPAPR